MDCRKVEFILAVVQQVCDIHMRITVQTCTIKINYWVNE